MTGARKLTAMFAIVTALLGSAGASASQPYHRVVHPSILRARKAPEAILARQAFGRIAPMFVEVERPTFEGMRPLDRPLDGLRFATRARSSGDLGLCEATAVSVDFSTPDTDQPPLTSETLYKVVGTLAPIPGVIHT